MPFWDPPEGRMLVGDVAIHGNEALDESDITDLISTHSDNWALGEKPLYDAAEVAEDARRIKSIYASYGYFEARVRSYRVEEIDDEAVRIHFTVYEGRPARVTSVRLEGLDPPTAGDPAAPGDDDPEGARRLAEIAAEFEAEPPFEAGQIWREEAHEQAKAILLAELRDAGFVYAMVLGDVRVDRERAEAEVRYLAAPGPLTRMGDIEVRGARAQPESRYLRRVELRPGGVVDTDALHQMETGIQDLGVTLSVDAEPVRKTAAELLAGREPTWENLRALPYDPEVTVRITVQELPLREVRTGVGAGIDSQRSEVYARAGFRHRNFLGGTRYLDVEAKPMIVMLPALWNPTKVGPGGEVGLAFHQPSFLEEYLRLTARGDYELGFDSGYRSHAVRGFLGLARRLFDKLHAEIGYGAELYKYFDYASILDVIAAEQASGSSLGLDFSEQAVLSYLQQVLTLDLRDSVFDAREGFFAQLRVQEGLHALASDFQYFRFLGDVRGYWTPWSRLTLALRVRYGHILAARDGQVPLPVRFLGGGASDMRGFASNKLGPLLCNTDLETPTCSRSDRVDVGGNASFLGSFEARFHLPWDFQLVAFADVGQVWATESDIYFGELELAVGPGLRYLTPFGPLRLDLGMLLTTPNPPGLELHFSIGQAF